MWVYTEPDTLQILVSSSVGMQHFDPSKSTPENMKTV